MQADHVQPSTRPDQHASVIQGPFVQSSVAEHPTVSESLMPGCRVTATANFADHQVTPHASGGVTGFETCCAKARKRMSCDDAASNSRTESKPSSQAVAADHLPNETIRAAEPVREVPAFAADHVQTKLCPLGKIDTANDPAYGDISLSALPTFNTRHDNNRHAQQQCPSVHPGLDRPPMSPPAPFHAMPLPRLGCGGPSQCDENDGKSDADPAFPTCPSDLPEIKPFKRDEQVIPSQYPRAMPPPRLGCGGPSHGDEQMIQHVNGCSNENGDMTHVLAGIESTSPKDSSSIHPTDRTLGTDQMKIYVKHEMSDHPCPCVVARNCTAGTLTQAEANLGSLTMPIAPRSLVGTHLPLDKTLHPDQHVLLFQNFPKSIKCPFTTAKLSIPFDSVAAALPCTRLEALWQQQAWVAIDEMNYYLEATQFEDRAFSFPATVFLHEADVAETAHEWLDTAINTSDTSRPWCSAAIIACHWVPLVVSQDDHVVRVCTTPEGSCLIEEATKIANALGKTIEVTQKILPQCFTADCGFQSVAWLLAILSNLPVEAMTDDRAAQWRQLFINELCRQDKCDEWISHLDLGGAKLDQSEMTKLTSLLTQHGVWPDRALERANQLISAMPAVNIRNILASHRPWQDLKAAANGVKPQIKLIMIDELNAQIANRADQRKYGKKMSSHKRHEPAKDNLTVQASELMVPQGVFKQQDGTILGPLQVGDVGPNAKGVLLVDQADCQATLRLPKPVSQMGLAVIVLATKNNEDMHSITPTRFPAMCLSTQEPLIASGYMYQLDHQEVIRHEPSNKLAIDEQPTEAIRCMVFKDQAGDFWEQLQQQPVNHIFQTEPLLATPPGSTSIVIDVWDRQWVSKKYEKVRPANAEVFTFSMRMLADKADELLAKSGQAGVYWEPRSACGRFPNSNYHVTWLPPNDIPRCQVCPANVTTGNHIGQAWRTIWSAE